MNTRIHVVVGVIYNSDRSKVLITKRTAKQHLAGYWEFPGGKVKNNEGIFSALNRELNEELAINVDKAEQLTKVGYDYPDKKVLLDVWEVLEWTGEPQSIENQEIVWASISQLNNFGFPEANQHIIQTIQLSPVYLISQASYQDSFRLFSVVDECFSSGVKLFQLRLASKYEPKFPLIIARINELAKKYDAKIILNGTPADINIYDVAGIHLKTAELPKYKSRPISEKSILGASCHNEIELLMAKKLNVNYAFISPVSITSSHPDKKPIGWNRFYQMSKKVNFPVYALGGMRPADLKVAKSYNAHGIAMISAIWNSTMPIKKMLPC